MSRLGIVCAAVLTALHLGGCATAPEDLQDDGSAIAAVVSQWTTALIAHDVDAMMPHISEAFADSDGNDKEAFHTFISNTIEQGVLDDLEVATDNVVMTIDEDAATYDGVMLTSALGSVILDLTLARETDGWKIVSLLAS